MVSINTRVTPSRRTCDTRSNLPKNHQKR